ncbi:hypothetical protein Q7P36_008284 [Cladosporium allicinum]
MADKRFAALASDPRYRLPSKKQAQTAVDPRFKRLFTDQGFQKKATVDRYGRKLKPDSGKKDLEKRFRLEDDDEDNEPKKGKLKKPTREVVGSSDESEEESDDGEGQVVDAARGGGFAESSSEEESSEEEDSANEAELAEETAGMEQEEVPMGEVSKRIAAVNLDWDNIRAADIMAVAASFVPAGGRIENVTIYPSEFGRERMEREELEGPPREIFASTKRKEESEDDSDSDEDEDEKIRKRLLKEQAGEGEEFDDGKLRQYQLERLRYYYAVIECDSNNTAKTIYDSLDNREYLTTSNFFDLRFIPDEVTFDDDNPREHCTKLPDGYKPNDFRTEALTHSKVRLTWDDDDTTRKEVQKRAFSRAELDENDLQAYIGSDSSDNDSVSSRKSVSTADRKINKREAERQKMRAALGLSEAASTGRSKKAKDEPVGDMQITFSSGLTSGKGSKGVFENEPQDEESTRQRYIRKEKERKARRKEKSKATRGEGEDAAAGGDHSGSEQEETAAPADDKAAADEEDPFNDPFFNDPTTAAATEKSARKADKAKKRAERDAADAEAASRRAELELLMADDEANGEGVRHFDMREIEKAEKEARRKGKNKGKKSKKTAEADVKDDFKVQAEDPRFKALFDSHEYAIDPTNPRFKGTEGMKSLLEEGRKKRKREDREIGGEGEGVEVAKKNKKGKAGKEAKAEGGDDDLKGLVARLKKGKSKQ